MSSAVTKVVLCSAPASSSSLVPLGHDLAVADQDHLVGDLLDLVEQVAGQADGATAVGVPLEQSAHPADAGRVEAVRGLVEDQHGRVAEQCVGDAETLLHAERVVPQPALGLGLVEGDQLEHLVDPRHRQPHGQGAEGEDLAAGAAGVLGRGVEQHADVTTWVGDVLVEVAADRDPARVGGVRPTMTRIVVVLPAPFGPRKPVTRPGWQMKLTSSTAAKLPYRRVSPSTLIMRPACPRRSTRASSPRLARRDQSRGACRPAQPAPPPATA